MTIVQTTPLPSAAPAPGFRLRAAQFWIQTLVALSRRRPRMMRALRSIGVWFAWNCSSPLRDATTANARRVLLARAAKDGTGAPSPAHCRRLAKAMVGNFYDFLIEMARGGDGESHTDPVESIQGEEHYKQARQAGKGAILVTAHIGSFEAAAAVLTAREPRVRVVFQRDPMPLFERMRSQQHRRIGLIESPVNPASGEDAWTVWLSLRDALTRDEVVLMQGDRVMPGQRGNRLPFLGGHIVMPPGPVKLALVTGAPIIPVCAPRTADGRVRIIMEEPIWATPCAPGHEGPHPAERELARIIEGWVSRFAEQWMMVQRVWCEDGAKGAPAAS